MSRILVWLAVVVGMAMPALAASAGVHTGSATVVDHAHHQHSSIDPVGFPASDDGATEEHSAVLTCDAATGHCAAGFTLPHPIALRLLRAHSAAHRFHPDAWWQHQVPDTLTPPPRA